LLRATSYNQFAPSPRKYQVGVALVPSLV